MSLTKVSDRQLRLCDWAGLALSSRQYRYQHVPGSDANEKLTLCYILSIPLGQQYSAIATL